jgi:hypothetical protein
MSDFKQASKLKLRFLTSKGMLSVEQLWDLSQNDLSNSIKAVKKVLKKNDDDELSFLEDSKVVDTENQLKFDILKDVYLTKKKELDDARDALQIKERNQKILSLIAEKQDESLKSLSIDELKALIK